MAKSKSIRLHRDRLPSGAQPLPNISASLIKPRVTARNSWHKRSLFAPCECSRIGAPQPASLMPTLGLYQALALRPSKWQALVSRPKREKDRALACKQALAIARGSRLAGVPILREGRAGKPNRVGPRWRPSACRGARYIPGHGQGAVEIGRSNG